MRKFLIILLLPSFLTISKVVSTEKEVVYTSKEIYYLSQSDFGIYFREKLSSPMVYGEVPVYANEDLVVESGKLTPKTSFQITEWRLNKQGIPVFKLSNHQFIAADKRFLYDQSEVTPTIKKVWLESDFKLYNSPYDLKEVKSSLSAYSQVSIDKTMFVEGREFLHIDQAGWVAKESTSEEDNRMSKVQEMLSEKYQKDSFSIYVKQLTTGKEAGINQDEKMYAASVLKLSYLYYTQEK
ncbi:putative exported protein [Streptococcus pneumoniae GA54644]|nr:putative exported protein [Streptococcus pneumoniae GA54644]